jgi:hypothetical protein
LISRGDNRAGHLPGMKSKWWAFRTEAELAEAQRA